MYGRFWPTEVLLLTRSGPSCILQPTHSQRVTRTQHFSALTPLRWMLVRKTTISLQGQHRGGYKVTIELVQKPGRIKLLTCGMRCPKSMDDLLSTPPPPPEA